MIWIKAPYLSSAGAEIEQWSGADERLVIAFLRQIGAVADSIAAFRGMGWHRSIGCC